MELRIINGHYLLRCRQRLNLQQLHAVLLHQGRLYNGRPTMLSCRLMGKRVQFFPNGTIQVLADNLTPLDFVRLRGKIRDSPTVVPKRNFDFHCSLYDCIECYLFFSFRSLIGNRKRVILLHEIILYFHIRR